MNLARHAEVLWRFRGVTVAGVALGIAVALLTSYQISFDRGVMATPRGFSTYSSVSSLLITQPGFPEGRVVLPAQPIPATDSDGTPVEQPRNELQFADPGRFPVLADLYAQLAVSDKVRARIPGRPTAAQITVMPVTSPSGQSTLPALQFTTLAPNPAEAQALNVAAVAALRDLIGSEQAKSDVPSNQRIKLPTLNAPSAAVQMSGPSRTGAILALLLCLLGTVAVTHLLAVLRDRQQPKQPEDMLMPWGVGGTGEPEEQPEPVAPSSRRAS